MLRSSLRVVPPLARPSSSLLSPYHHVGIPRPITPLLRSSSFKNIPILQTTRRYASSSSSSSTIPPPTASSPPPRPKGKNIIFIGIPLAIGAFLIGQAMRDNKDKDEELNQKSSQFDTEKLYASKGTGEIAFSWLILKLCSFEFVVEYGPRLLQWAESNFLAAPARWMMKYTFFKHFVAGETQEETTKAVENLKKAGMGIVLDYSIEAGSGSPQELDRVANDIISTVHLAAKDPTPSFACLKVSGLTTFALLERLSQIITYYNNAKALPLHWVDNNVNANFEYSPRVLPSSSPLSSPPAPLSAEEKTELNQLMERLDRICKESHDNQVALLFDAEQTYYQPAIDCLTLHFCKKYNRKMPIVFNTYQMYLRDGPERLKTDIAAAKKAGYLLGVKIVRGAYMHTERRRALELGYPDPITPNIEATHDNYYGGLELAFANLSNVGVMIASHNEDTVVKTIGRLRELNIDPKSSRVQFAQLYGMGDHLSFLVLQKGYRVFKYVPYGPIEHVIPYLVRRMQENRGFIGSASDTERRLLWRELRRRLGFPYKPPTVVAKPL